MRRTRRRPLTSIRETADIRLARVADGETIVLAGFTRDRHEVLEERQAAGIKGGWFGRKTRLSRRSGSSW